jgi:hypothetical protein
MIGGMAAPLHPRPILDELAIDAFDDELEGRT